jgi:hypothetical protein
MYGKGRGRPGAYQDFANVAQRYGDDDTLNQGIGDVRWREKQEERDRQIDESIKKKKKEKVV